MSHSLAWRLLSYLTPIVKQTNIFVSPFTIETATLLFSYHLLPCHSHRKSVAGKMKIIYACYEDLKSYVSTSRNLPVPFRNPKAHRPPPVPAPPSKLKHIQNPNACSAHCRVLAYLLSFGILISCFSLFVMQKSVT